MPIKTATKPSAKSTAPKTTPMMQQFMEIKIANPGKLLFFRMGDFYELFFDDAVAASMALNITLTKRGKHNGEDIPMCGVPVHASTQYLQKLARKGFKVAIVDQLEDPKEAKKRGPKAVVKRGVVRIVTAGTLTEDSLLNARLNNYLLSIVPNIDLSQTGEPMLAVAWVDISTGNFACETMALNHVNATIARLEAKEIIYAPNLVRLVEPYKKHKNSIDYLDLWIENGAILSPLEAKDFDSQQASVNFSDYFKLADIADLGGFNRSELSALGGLYSYIQDTQKGQMPILKRPDQHEMGSNMLIDAATRTSLEILKTQTGDKKGSLLHAIDRTITGQAARLLANRLASPLTDRYQIEARLDMIAWFLTNSHVVHDFRDILKNLPDMERALARIAIGRSGPRDLVALRTGFLKAQQAEALFLNTAPESWPKPLKTAIETLNLAHCTLNQKLIDNLNDDVPMMTRDGGFIRAQLRPDLDEAQLLSKQGRQFIVGLEQKYSQLTQIKNLRIKHNNMLGYFIEVTAANGDVLLNQFKADFIHRQTMKNVVRFSSVELSELEVKISTAANRALDIEFEEFEKLVKATIEFATSIGQLAASLAALDVAASLALLSGEENFCRPKIDNSTIFDIENGRHIVVEQALKTRNEAAFIANSCVLNGATKDRSARILLLTGPNMAGKSTYLRQNALIAILAQMGCYVPAQKAHIGIVDKLFSRVGAADDLARGRSTFMVEMVETAAILNQATEKSLVILDEIGRGTATYDGLSIAWATIEHLHEHNVCRSLFATHYHELTALKEKLQNLTNATMRVAEWNGEVRFLHEVRKGVAERSYGIHVAKLAGLPQVVIERATEVLEYLEKNETSEMRQNIIDDLPLFSHARPKSGGIKSTDPQAEKLKQRVLDILPDELTPRVALELIYQLKKIASTDV
ncbi:MAG: DNA mismatch repair protein MutS [Rhizobiales bacterium]|nr:DNA mismatch repair protein MutS [Hyphomicrobiales bacterium]NRB15262.1 DNA mismatch repair protein MutS [Hyphomicrobiales bacterium]